MTDLEPETDEPDEPTAPEAPEAPDEQSIGRKAAGGFVWALLGFLLMQLGSFGTYSVASRILGTDGVGVVGASVTIVFWIDILLGLGLTAALIYEQEKGQTDRVAVAFTLNAAVASVLSVLIFVFAESIDRFFGADHPEMFRVVALLVFVKAMGQVPDSMLKRDLDFRKRVRADLTRSILRFTVATGLLVAGVGPVSLVIGVTVAEIAAVAVIWFNAKFRPRLHFDRAIAGEMLKFGSAMFGAQLVGMLWLNGDYLVISNHFGAKSEEFGNYFTAFRLPELILGSVFALFSNVAFPAYSAARESGAETLRNASLKSLRLLCFFGFSVGVGMALVARDFITVWFGDDFLDAIPIMQLLCAAAGFASVGYASGDLFPALGKPRLGLYFNLLFTPILIGGFLLVVDRGVVAVATVHVAVIVPYALFRIQVANRLLGTTWRESLAALRPAAVTVLGMVALALPVRLTLDAGILALVAIVAAGGVGALGGLAVGDRVMLAEIQAGAGKVAAKLGR